MACFYMMFTQMKELKKIKHCQKAVVPATVRILPQIDRSAIFLRVKNKEVVVKKKILLLKTIDAKSKSKNINLSVYIFHAS